MTGLLLSARERKSRAARKAPARCLYKGSAAWSLLRHEASRDTATLELQNLHHRQHPALESLEKQRGRMENNSSSHPPPPPGQVSESPWPTHKTERRLGYSFFFWGGLILNRLVPCLDDVQGTRRRQVRSSSSSSREGGSRAAGGRPPRAERKDSSKDGNNLSICVSICLLIAKFKTNFTTAVETFGNCNSSHRLKPLFDCSIAALCCCWICEMCCD